MTVAVIDAITRAWDDIQQRNAAVPGVTILLIWGHRGTQCGSTLWNGVPILLVDEEILNRNAEAVLSWLLHQAAHELADGQRPSGPARDSRRHDAVFRSAAKALGLEVEKDQAESSGWSTTIVPETLAPRYAFTTNRLANALTQRQAPALKLTMASCQCVPARRILIPPASLDRGEIRCQVCGKPFRTREQGS